MIEKKRVGYVISEESGKFITWFLWKKKKHVTPEIIVAVVENKEQLYSYRHKYGSHSV